MANNRMWLVNTKTGERTLIAKYYPSCGWDHYYGPHREGVPLGELFVNSPATPEAPYGNPDQWRLEFDHSPSDEAVKLETARYISANSQGGYDY